MAPHLSRKRVDAVLERSVNPATRFFGLQILEDTIKTRWKILPAEEREGIKNYIVGKIVEISREEARMQAEKIFLNKLNVILVHILKQEWPQNWPSFIPDIVQFSQTSEVLCENNIRILKLLSEGEGGVGLARGSGSDENLMMRGMMHCDDENLLMRHDADATRATFVVHVDSSLMTCYAAGREIVVRTEVTMAGPNGRVENLPKAALLIPGSWSPVSPLSLLFLTVSSRGLRLLQGPDDDGQD